MRLNLPTIITLSRIILIPFFVLIAPDRPMGGKLKTFSQITAILCLIIGMNIFGIDLYDVGIVFIWIALVLSIVSGVQYTVSFWKKL